MFHREAAKVLLTSLQGFKVHITWLLSSSFSSFSFVFQLSYICHQICTVYLIYIIVRVKLCDSWVIKLFVISQSPTLSIFQTKTQMNDLMDGLIQDMSTGNYTTKRPYPASRFEVWLWFVVNQVWWWWLATIILSLIFYFFKQKTAYEITTRLVGSEMCIRDSNNTIPNWSCFCFMKSSLHTPVRNISN